MKLFAKQGYKKRLTKYNTPGGRTIPGALRRAWRRAAGEHRRDAEVGELTDAVLDVELQPPEGLHQRFDVEAFLRPRAQVAQNPGAERRHHLQRRRFRAAGGWGERVQ